MRFNFTKRKHSQLANRINHQTGLPNNQQTCFPWIAIRVQNEICKWKASLWRQAKCVYLCWLPQPRELVKLLWNAIWNRFQTTNTLMQSTSPFPLFHAPKSERIGTKIFYHVQHLYLCNIKENFFFHFMEVKETPKTFPKHKEVIRWS